MNKPKLSMIVAMSENRVIGRDGQLPWHIPQDLKRFKKLTMGHPILMGRKTFESIGRVLPKRRNLIVTRNPGYQVAGAEVFGSIDQALEKMATDGEPEVFIIGGAEIFRVLMDRVDRILLTQIHQEVEGDVKMPAFGPNDFDVVAREDIHHDPQFSYIDLERRSLTSSVSTP